MRVAILGAGMSGLVAAKALYDIKQDFDIYDRCTTNVSQQKGLHYLHGNCGLSLEPNIIKNLVFKPSDLSIPDYIQYSIKVWGNDSVLNNSVRNLPKSTIVYDFRQGFNILMNEFEKFIIKAEVTPDFVQYCQKNYDIIISTIPIYIIFPDIICESEIVYTKEGLPVDLELKDGTVAYNLFIEVPWYRTSNVFGQCYTEYVENKPDAIPIKKIKTQTSVNVYDIFKKHNIMLVGRFAEWNRKRLVHQIYDIVKEGVIDWKKYRQNMKYQILE